jgi:ferrous iron transport protein A
MVPLNMFELGACFRLIDFGEAPIAYRNKLISLGLTRGVEVKVIRKAPLGCPLQIEVKGTYISLRKEEALALHWEAI